MDPKVIAETQAHLARLRWKGTTKRERSEAMREVARKGWASGKRPKATKRPRKAKP